MKPSRRKLLYAAVTVVLALGLAAMLRPRPTVVEPGRVGRGPLEVAIEEEGQTRIHPRYVVAAPVTGRLAQLELDPGDRVAAEAVVARLTPAPLDAREREQAEARIAAAEAAGREADARVAEAAAAATQAASTLARYRELAAAGQLTAEQLERAATEEQRAARSLDAAQARASAARFEVASARSALLDAGAGATVEVRAPFAGSVLRLHEDSERVVPAGAPILELGDPRDLEVVVEVLSTDAVAIPAGAAMTVDVGGGRRLAARVAEIEPAGFTKISPLGVEEQRVRVIGALDQPAAGVGDRFRIRARIVLWRGDDVLQAPAGAVFRAGEGWACYRIDGGRARWTPVEVGQRALEGVEIRAGLEAGALVVLYPGERLRDGARVRLAPGS